MIKIEGITKKARLALEAVFANWTHLILIEEAESDYALYDVTFRNPMELQIYFNNVQDKLVITIDHSVVALERNDFYKFVIV